MSHPWTVEQIVEGLRSDSPAQRETFYREVVERYKKLVYSVAWKFAREPDLADEIFQESFLRLFRNIHNLRAPKAFSSFFRRIILSCANDLISKRSREARVSDSLPELSYEFDHSFLEALFLVPYIRELPELQQKIIELEFFEGRSPKEAAEALGINERSERVYKHRALDRMRRRLQEDSNLVKTK